MGLKQIARGAAACALIAGMALPGVAAAQGNSPFFAGSGIPRHQHIFEIMMENHNYDEIIGNPNAPQINALAAAYGLATNYYGVTHPSEPNYVASIGGSYFGIQDDNPYNTAGHTVSAPNLADQLTTAGLTWKGYFQSLPPYDPSNPTDSGPYAFKWPSNSVALYASKHNPFINFTGTQGDRTNMVDDSQLTADLQSGNVPNFSYIVPNQCHDMHGTGGCSDDTALIQAGDTYVGSAVNAIMSSSVWQQGNNAIVITWDEDDFSATNLGCCDSNPGGGHVATIVIANHGVRGVLDATPYNHYSLLATIEDAFHLGCLANSCDTANVKPMTALFQTAD